MCYNDYSTNEFFSKQMGGERKMKKEKVEKNKKKNRDAGKVFTRIMALILVVLMLAGTVGSLAYYLFTNI